MQLARHRLLFIVHCNVFRSRRRLYALRVVGRWGAVTCYTPWVPYGVCIRTRLSALSCCRGLSRTCCTMQVTSWRLRLLPFHPSDPVSLKRFVDRRRIAYGSLSVFYAARAAQCMALCYGYSSSAQNSVCLCVAGYLRADRLSYSSRWWHLFSELFSHIWYRTTWLLISKCSISEYLERLIQLCCVKYRSRWYGTFCTFSPNIIAWFARLQGLNKGRKLENEFFFADFKRRIIGTLAGI